MHYFLGISIGDINGIGPEVILKFLGNLTYSSSVSPVLFAHPEILEFYAQKYALNMPSYVISSVEKLQKGVLNCVPVQSKCPEVKPGIIAAESARYAQQSIKIGTESILKGYTKGLVTAPISKEAMNKIGFAFPGHTEYLAALCGKNHQALMILANDTIRVALATVHIPLRNVAEKITQKHVFKTGLSFLQALKMDFGIPEPKIAVLGLNPHAGDGGVLGNEEKEHIEPAIRALNQHGNHFEGPFAADGFFGSGTWKQFDGIFAMYHDQGLIPFKTLAFHSGVNVTCNLPIVRTSPDHGTGFAIAGQGLADAQSFTEAYKMAQQIITNRGLTQ